MKTKQRIVPANGARNGNVSNRGGKSMRFTGRLVLSILSVVWAGSLAQAAVELLGVRTTVERQATTFLLRLPARVEYSPTRIAPWGAGICRAPTSGCMPTGPRMSLRSTPCRA